MICYGRSNLHEVNPATADAKRRVLLQFKHSEFRTQNARAQSACLKVWFLEK